MLCQRFILAQRKTNCSVRKKKRKKLFLLFDVFPSLTPLRTVIFKIYDIDGDGYISNGELFKVLKMMVGNNLTDIQLQQVPKKITFRFFFVVFVNLFFFFFLVG